MTKHEINTLHELHPMHQRCIIRSSDLPHNQVLESDRIHFSENELLQLEALGSSTYAEGKWTVKELLQHMIDTERIMAYRALRIARNDTSPRSGFDEEAFAAHTLANTRTITELLAELDLVRTSTIMLFESFDRTMLSRKGLCAGIEISVLALAHLIAGHALHHLYLLHRRYFPLLLPAGLELVINDPALSPHFASLNKQWIEKGFKLEPDDIEVLEQAQSAIIAKGGHILYALLDGEVAGTVALQPIGGGLEMIKMAVSEAYRGKGIGKWLIVRAIEQAQQMGARRMQLYSNTSYNAQAVSLYHHLGFREVELGESRYKRANIKMEINL